MDAGRKAATTTEWEEETRNALRKRHPAWMLLAAVAILFSLVSVSLDGFAEHRQAPLPDHFVVDLNLATEEELHLLPGVGPKLVAAILAYREAHGGFTRIEELTTIPGIKEGKLRSLRPHVTVDPHHARH